MKKESEAFAKRERESEERRKAAMRLIEEEEHRKVQLNFLDANRTEQRSYRGMCTDSHQ